jgi:hypothetical protein
MRSIKYFLIYNKMKKVINPETSKLIIVDGTTYIKLIKSNKYIRNQDDTLTNKKSPSPPRKSPSPPRKSPSPPRKSPSPPRKSPSPPRKSPLPSPPRKSPLPSPPIKSPLPSPPRKSPSPPRKSPSPPRKSPLPSPPRKSPLPSPPRKSPSPPRKSLSPPRKSLQQKSPSPQQKLSSSPKKYIKLPHLNPEIIREKSLQVKIDLGLMKKKINYKNKTININYVPCILQEKGQMTCSTYSVYGLFNKILSVKIPERMRRCRRGTWDDIAKTIGEISNEYDIYFVDIAIFDEDTTIIESAKYDLNIKSHKLSDDNKELYTYINSTKPTYIIANLQGGRKAHYISLKIQNKGDNIDIEICDSDKQPNFDFVEKNIEGLIKSALNF